MRIIPATEQDFQLSSYDFELPEELIAQVPCVERGADRLYVLNRQGGASVSGGGQDELAAFSDLPALLPPNSLLVANNSKVARARILGQRPSGGVLEVMLLSPPPLLEATAVKNGKEYCAIAQALLRPAKKIKVNQRYDLALGLAVRILEKQDFGQAKVELIWSAEGSPKSPLAQGSTGCTARHSLTRNSHPEGSANSATGTLSRLIAETGRLPLPPYIKREPSAEDAERYQTIYADDSKAGSLAAPTAGLHFTPEIKKSLEAAGHEWAELTLFVGYGTFSPVRVLDIRDHEMHPEYVDLPAATVRQILAAKAEGRPVFAVGTTSARVLEGVAAELAEQNEQTDSLSIKENTVGTPGFISHSGAGKAASGLLNSGLLSFAPALLAPKEGWLNCFIHPGKPIRVIDGLITNFHLPESSLLMLVSALTGRERLLESYQRAVAERLRFFSYGDAMLIR